MNTHQQSKTKRERKAIKVTHHCHAVIACTRRENYFFLPVTYTELSRSLTGAVVVFFRFFGGFSLDN